jgi:hypothetical protein
MDSLWTPPTKRHDSTLLGARMRLTVAPRHAACAGVSVEPSWSRRQRLFRPIGLGASPARTREAPGGEDHGGAAAGGRRMWYGREVGRRRPLRQIDPELYEEAYRAARARGGQVRASHMTQHERSSASVRAVRARWAQTPTEERVWWAHFLRSHQKRFQGLLPALGPKPVCRSDQQSAAPVIAPRKPVSEAIPKIVIPHRLSAEPPYEPWRLRPGRRYDV